MFDPFKILGLPKEYALDLKLLEERYFEEQKRVHPDRFTLADSNARAEALKKSTALNQAYLLLKDPLQRAFFLMQVAGIEPLSHDPEFLSEVMVWNERLENGENLISELRFQEEILSKNLAEAFKENDFEKARISHYRLTYIQKLLKDILKAKGWIATGPTDAHNDENMNRCERSEAIQK